MYEYSVFEWISFFMIYCFLGWMFESLYVSWECKKWVNRGFLNGPFLPIYGFGAIIMLFVDLPVKNNIILIFLFGMMAATILEYITGWAIEKMFKVRYWDYTYEPFNLNGYICLECSLTWGFCSVILTKLIHSFVSKIVVELDDLLVQIVAILFFAYFLFDVIISVRQALDVRKIIIEYIKNNEEIKRIQKRIDVIVAVINDDRENAKAELEMLRKTIKERHQLFHEKTERLQKRALKVFKRNPKANNKIHLINNETIKNILSSEFHFNKDK